MQRVQPPLTSGGEAGPIADLDNLRLGELRVKICPQRVVCEIRVPQDGISITQRNLLPMAEPV